MSGLLDRNDRRKRRNALSSARQRYGDEAAERARLDNAPVGSVGAPGGLLHSAQRQRQDPVAGLLAAGSMLPGGGDLAGPVADAYMYATQPESREVSNYLMSAAGLLPFVPSLAPIKYVDPPEWSRSTEQIPVGINPTYDELEEILDETVGTDQFEGVLRALKNTGNNYLWPAAKALHADIAKALRLKGVSQKDFGGFVFAEDIAPRWKPFNR